MKCPHCRKMKIRCRLSKSTGRYYLYCEHCKEELDLIEKPDGTWVDTSCTADCENRTMRHDIIGKYLICRGCHNVRLKDNTK